MAGLDPPLERFEVVVDEILVGVGRAPNVDGLGLETVNVDHDPRAGVKVDEDRLDGWLDSTAARKAVERDAVLALPTDRMRIPNERELFLDGRVQGSAVVRDVARQDFQGSYGYVME